MMERSDLEQWKSREVARLLALVETERRYWQEIVSTLPVPLAILNHQMILVSANRAFRMRFGVRSEDLRTRRVDAILPYPELVEAVQRALDAQGPVHEPLILEKPDGGARLRVTVQPHRDWDEDTAIQVLLAVEDLTHASEPVAGVRKATQSLAATLPAVVWTATLPTMQFSLVSDSSLSVAGIPAERWLDPGFWIARFDEAGREAVVSAYNKAFGAGPGTYSFEFRLDGNPNWFRETIRIDDDRTTVQGVLTDVTDRRAIEEHLLQRQRMEALANFAGRAAHDLNNPLMIVSGYGEELFESLTETDPRRNDLGQMLAAAKRIGDIASGMQQFSRKPAGTTTALTTDASAAIDLAGLLVETVDRMRTTAGPSLQVDYAPPPPGADPILVFADSSVLQNLIYEITAAMADGAPEVHIAIQTQERQVREQAFGDQLSPGVYASITVENRGATATGASARRNMFETILPGKDGSEVGLALARAFRQVEGWGGSIWTSANGAFVRILLRAYKAQPAQAPVTQAAPSSASAAGPVAVPPPPPAPPKRILVVDDEMGIRSLMRKILMREGYSVLEAASAKEALAAIEQEPVDLLLTDVIMPETSGRQLAEQVVAKYPETRVLYVSGYTGETLVESGQFPPGSRLLQKPVTLGSLLRAVKEVLTEGSIETRARAASAGTSK